MKCKLTNSEMKCLVNVFDVACDLLDAKDHPEDKLYLAIYQEMRIGVEQKLIMRKSKYSMTMKPYQALAFWISFNKVPNTDQASNLLMKLCNSIHRQYLAKGQTQKLLVI